MNPVEPKPASTVLLLRDDEHGLEVFLVRRHDNVAFMAGAYVFPGGRLDEADRQSGIEPFQAAAVRELHEETGVRLPPDALVPWAHWVTPASEPRRYDTRFFAAHAPSDQTPVHDNQETVDGAWMTPGRAIARCRAGEILLPPPTWITLRELEPFATAADAIDWARRRTIVRRQPDLVERDGRKILFMPGDPDHPVGAIDVPGVETRFVLVDGRWRPMT
jgi:8-oxo-dGTP pyrophosphatase MutT (NUDIX family)